MSPDITHPLDDLAVYALDALDDTERALVDAHLASCAACRNELDQHLATLSHLTSPDEPPPELWDRIARQTRAMPRPAAVGSGGWSGAGQAGVAVAPVDAIRETGSRLSPPTGPSPAAPNPLAGAREPGGSGDGSSWVPRHSARRRRPPSRQVWLGAVAAMTILVVAIAVGAVLSGSSDDPPTVAELAQAAAEDPDATVVNLSAPDAGGQARARIVTTGDPTGYVLFDELPRLQRGHSYQVWKFDQRNVPVSLGVVGDGSGEAAAIAVPEGATSFAITDEPTPDGVPAPTGPIVAQGNA
jgi:anti-sigma-K factor RskA